MSKESFLKLNVSNILRLMLLSYLFFTSIVTLIDIPQTNYAERVQWPYYRIAGALDEGRGYSDLHCPDRLKLYKSFRPPLNVFIIYGLSFFSKNIAVHAQVFYLFWIMTLAAWYFITLKLSQSKILSLTYIFFLYHMEGHLSLFTTVSSETTYLLLVSLSLLSYLYGGQMRRAWFFSGIFLGASILIRSLFLYPLMILTLIYPYLRWKKVECYSKVHFFLIGAWLLVIPWTIRNYYTLNDFVLVSTHSGINLVQGTYDNNEDPNKIFRDYTCQNTKDEFSEVAENSFLKKVAFQRIGKNSLGYVKIKLEQFARGSFTNQMKGKYLVMRTFKEGLISSHFSKLNQQLGFIVENVIFQGVSAISFLLGLFYFYKKENVVFFIGMSYLFIQLLTSAAFFKWRYYYPGQYLFFLVIIIFYYENIKDLKKRIRGD